jgi:hypothetical protein
MCEVTLSTLPNPLVPAVWTFFEFFQGPKIDLKKTATARLLLPGQVVLELLELKIISIVCIAIDEYI